MPLPGDGGFDGCVDYMMEEEGHDRDASESICGAIEEERKSDNGDPQALMDALERGAGLIADVGVDLVSGVDVPAVDSKWVMTKSGGARKGHDFRANSPILLSKADDEDQRIAYAAAMIPREPDKEGDVVPTPTVEKAAHDFIKSHGGVDTDHSLIDGEGEVVESWVLKEERTFDLPGGETETYPAGTWMTGIEWGKDAWERIKAGELTGLSIYGMAEHVTLDKACGCAATAKQLDIPLANEAVVHLVYESQTAAEKASEEIGLDGAVHEHEFDGMTVFMPGETHEEFVERYMELSDEADEVAAEHTDTNGQSGDTHKGDAGETGGMAQDQASDGSTGDSTDDGPTIGEVAASVDELSEAVESVKDAVEAEKQDEQEAAATLAEAYDDVRPGDVIDIIEAAASRGVDAVLEAAESAKEDDMDDDEEDDDEMESSAEKRADDANLDKGGDGTQTAAKGIESGGDSGASLSYREIAEQQEGA